MNKCAICGCDISAKTLTGLCKTCVHKSLDVIFKKRWKQLDNIKNGIHKGWKSRKIISKPEKYFIRFLLKHKIKYEREVQVGRYRIDFLLKNNIALEINGDQHYRIKARIESDKQKDIYLVNKRIYAI